MVIGSSKVSPEPLSIPVSGGVSLGTRGAASLSPISPQGLGKTLSAFSKTTPEIGGSKENDRKDKVEKVSISSMHGNARTHACMAIESGRMYKGGTIACMSGKLRNLFNMS